MTEGGPDIGQIILSPADNTTLHGLGYKLLRKLGEGSYAKVYLSEYKAKKGPTPLEYYACKIIDTHSAPKDFVFRFLPREIDALAHLEHPYMVYTHSIFKRKGLYFIFMTYGTNGDLLEYISKNGPVAENQARIWFRQITLAIQYMHEMDYVHRDLKCENVLISFHGNMKVADFGFARTMTNPNGQTSLSETYCGSLSYVAPEILKGQPYNPKFADIWSMGVILYVMLNKALPFNDSNVKRLFEQQKARHWRFRARIIDQVSPEVKTVVTYLLEPEINKRFNIDNVLESEWFEQDSRLITLSPIEEEALKRARNIRAIAKSNMGFKKPIKKKPSHEESLIIIKPISTNPQEESKEFELP